MSGDLGATNACSWVYRPDFIVEHGMRSDKAVLGLPVPGAGVNRPRYGRYFSDEGLVRGRRFWLLFSPVRKVTRAPTNN